MKEKPGWERLLLAAAAMTICLVVLTVGLVGIIVTNSQGSTTVAPFYALLAVALFVGTVLWLGRRGKGPLPIMAGRLPSRLDGTFQRRPVVASLSFTITVVSIVQMARLSCFMVNPALRWGSAYPPEEFSVSHMCISAYVRAGELSRNGDPNVYEEKHYPAFNLGDSTKSQEEASTVKNLGPYLRDAFEYPPPFLILPRVALTLTNDFLVMRTGWFMLQALIFFAFSLTLAIWVGGTRGMMAGLLVPALIASFPFMFNFQFGQFHLFAIMLSIGGGLAFSKGSNRIGGALLGAAIVTKIFPALLLLYLAFQRRARPIVWTVVFSIIYVLAGWIVLGPAPYSTFLFYQIPRLMSGEAFSFNLTNDLTIATNASISSIPFKLNRLGISGISTQLAVALTWAYTAVLLIVTYLASRRAPEKGLEPAIWLGLLVLASLRSADAPIVYVGTAALWALTFLAVETRGRRLPVLLFVMAWMFTGVLPPLPTPEATIIFWMVVQFTIPTVGFYVVLHRQSTVPGNMIPMPLRRPGTQGWTIS